MSYIKFYPCQHTKMDGLYYSYKSLQETGRRTLVTGNREFTLRTCKECCKPQDQTFDRMDEIAMECDALFRNGQ